MTRKNIYWLPTSSEAVQYFSDSKFFANLNVICANPENRLHSFCFVVLVVMVMVKVYLLMKPSNIEVGRTSLFSRVNLTSSKFCYHIYFQSKLLSICDVYISGNWNEKLNFNHDDTLDRDKLIKAFPHTRSDVKIMCEKITNKFLIHN